MKNSVIINTIKGAKASAVVYSISETAKLNKINPYYYFMYLLDMIPKLLDEKGDIEISKLDPLLPWSKDLPTKCLTQSR